MKKKKYLYSRILLLVLSLGFFTSVGAEDTCNQNTHCYDNQAAKSIEAGNYALAVHQLGKAQAIEPTPAREDRINRLTLFDQLHGSAASVKLKSKSQDVFTRQNQKNIFDGKMSSDWNELATAGGNFLRFAHFADKMLIVDVPPGNSYGKTGIRSATPVIHFPFPEEDLATTLLLELDAVRSSSYVIALIPPNWDGIKEWRSHHIRVSLSPAEDGMSVLTLWFAKKAVMEAPVDPSVLNEVEIVLRPDRLVLVKDGSGKLLLQGEIDNRINPPKEGYRLSVLTEALNDTQGAKLALQRITVAQIPGVFSVSNFSAWPGSEESLLLQAPVIDHNWVGYELTRKGGFSKYTRFGANELVFEVPKDSGWARVGLRSEKPLIWLDDFGQGAQAEVTFQFKPEHTTGFAVALTPFYGLKHNEPSTPMIYLHWRKLLSGGAKLKLVTSRLLEPVMDRELRDGLAPAYLKIVLQPGRFRYVLPHKTGPWIEWDVLQSGQGLRVYAYSNPDQVDQSASMALSKIAVTYVAGKRISPDKQNRSVSDLPETLLFDGNPGDWWETSGVQVADVGKLVHFENGTMIATVEGEKNRDRSGLLSKIPILDFDARILNTSHQIEVKVKPEETTGLQMAFYKSKVADMWRPYMAAEVSFTRHTEGEYAGNYVLSLRSGINEYFHWWRLIDSDWVRKHWDGRLILEQGKGWMSVRLPGGPILRGVGFPFDKGTKLFMTVYAHPEKTYGKAKLVLQRITKKWILPEGTDRLNRWLFLDPEVFDPKAYQLELIRENRVLEEQMDEFDLE